MRPTTWLVTLSLLFSAGSAVAVDADGKLTEAEKTELLSMLDTTAKDFLALIENTTEEQWKWKSAPDRWSVGECAEHVILSERMLFQTALQALENPADPEWATKTGGKADFIKKVMPNRNPGGAGGAIDSVIATLLWDEEYAGRAGPWRPAAGPDRKRGRGARSSTARRPTRR